MERLLDGGSIPPASTKLRVKMDIIEKTPMKITFLRYFKESKIAIYVDVTYIKGCHYLKIAIFYFKDEVE